MELKVSVCITTFNEKEETIQELLNALDKQTLKADEVIVADATINTNYQTPFIKQYSKLNLQFINKTEISRSAGRNLAIRMARNEIIAITDAGCVPHKDWLENMVKPYNKVHLGGVFNIVVAGFYRMIARNNFEKAEAVFLGVKQQDMKSDFLPSARSMAFTKTIFKKVGGFPENLNDTAEDSVFNINLINAGAKFVVAKKAIVDWKMPESIYDFGLKIYRYAKGDAESDVWWHPVKKWRTHNLKVLTIFARYILGVTLFFQNSVLFILYAILYTLYTVCKAGLWGIILQFVSDFGCIIGFSHGIFSNCFKRN